MLKADLKALLEETTGAEVSDSLTVKVMQEQLFEAADPLPETNPNKSKELTERQFEQDGNVYEVIMGKVNIPGIGVLTAPEIAVDEAAQAYLVSNGCIGSVIKQIH